MLRSDRASLCACMASPAALLLPFRAQDVEPLPVPTLIPRGKIGALPGRLRPADTRVSTPQSACVITGLPGAAWRRHWPCAAFSPRASAARAPGAPTRTCLSRPRSLPRVKMPTHPSLLARFPRTTTTATPSRAAGRCDFVSLAIGPNNNASAAEAQSDAPVRRKKDIVSRAVESLCSFFAPLVVGQGGGAYKSTSCNK